MHRHGDVGRDRLGPRRGDRDELARLVTCGVDQRVAHVPEEARLLFVVDLEVAQRALVAGAPVDQAVASIYKALVVEVDEDRAHRQRRPGVHGELLARPVGADAQALVLGEDALAVAVDELPGLFEERLAADVAPVLALGRQLALDQRVYGDCGVVDARQPQRLATLHAPPAHKDVLDRVHHRVAEVQLTREVRRRHDHRVRLGVGVYVCRESAGVLPALVSNAFDRGGVVGTGHLGASIRFGRHRFSSIRGRIRSSHRYQCFKRRWKRNVNLQTGNTSGSSDQGRL